MGRISYTCVGRPFEVWDQQKFYSYIIDRMANPPKPVTPAALRRQARRIQAARRKLAAEQVERDRLIVEALRQGWTLKDAAAATGLTFGRIAHIRDARRAEGRARVAGPTEPARTNGGGP